MTALGMQYAPEKVEQRAVELAVTRSGMAWTILRPNWFYQILSTGCWASWHDTVTAVCVYRSVKRAFRSSMRVISPRWP